jgi:hypothetical protein
MTFLLDTENTGGDFQPVPPGIHLASCVFVVDIGIQPGNFGPKSRLLFVFETPGLLAPDGRPMTISRRFGKNLSEKGQLRPFLTSWLGQTLSGQLDLAQFAGKAAQLVVSHTQNGDKTFANIQAVAPVQPGTPVPPPSTFPLVYGPNRDPSVFAALPEWIRKSIATGGAAPAGVAAVPTMAPTFAAPAPAYPQAVYQAPPVNLQAVAQMTTAPQVTDPGAPFDDSLSF